jgi:phosphoribosylamine--glycine ligase
MDRARLHFGEVAHDDSGTLVASGETGYLMVATGVGPTVRAAQAGAYGLAARVHVPNLRYRNDVGDAFLAHGEATLTRLGWLAGERS